MDVQGRMAVHGAHRPRSLRRATAVVLLSCSVVVASVGFSAPAHATPSGAAAPALARPIGGVKIFWSYIIKSFITFSAHATSRMASRGISRATVQRILNEGQVVSRHNGVTTVKSGNIRVLVDSKTGNVITVLKPSGGGGGGGR